MATYIYTYDGNKYHYQGYVKDRNGNSIWEAHYPEFIEDEKSGEVIETSNIFDEGVNSPEDIKGVEYYLKRIGVLNKNDILTDEYFGGIIATSRTLNGIKKIIEDYYYSSNISLKKIDNTNEYEVNNAKGKIDSVAVIEKKGRFIFLNKYKYEQGGEVKKKYAVVFIVMNDDLYIDNEPTNIKIVKIVEANDKNEAVDKAVPMVQKENPDIQVGERDIYGVREVKDENNMARGGRAAEYETYHKTLASALSEAQNFVENRGYEFSEETYFPDLTMGGVKYGETISSTRDIVEVGGKNRKNTLVIVVYRMDSGTYELTMYFTKSNYAEGGEVGEKVYQKVKITIKDVDMGGDVVYKGDHWFRKEQIENKSNNELGDYIAKKYGLDYGNTFKYSVVRTNETKTKMADGGEIENENLEMLQNQIVQIKHHAEEIADINNVEIEPWVITKGQRAATDLSDITHYLDGKKAEEKMGYGGAIEKEFQVEFTWGDADDESRSVYIKADTKEDAEEKAKQKFGKAYEGFKIIKTQRSMKTGGKIETQSKNKLKATFELPLELVVYVPSTTTADRKISDEEFESRIDYVETYLSDLFGGYSATEVEGGYVSDEKGLIQEDVMKVTAFGQVDNFEDKFNQLLHQVKIWCEEWGQESIGFEFEGDLFYINKDSKFKDGGYMAKGGGFNQYGEPYGFDRDEYNDMISEYDRLCAFYEDAESDGERARLNVKIDALEDKINAYERMEKGGEMPSHTEISDDMYEGMDEVEDFFNADNIEEIYEEEEGVGRSQSNIIIFKSGDRYLKAITDFGFDDFHTKYYFIELDKMEDGGETDEYAKGGEVRYKLKGSNFGQQIESGQKFKALISKAFENQSGEQKYPENFIKEIAYTGKIVKNEGSNFLKDYSYKGTLTKFEFLDDKDFVEALKYLDRPLIKSFKFADGGETDDYAKGGNVPSIERRVAEVNAMIEDANEKGLEVVDEGQTWQAPMKYFPIKYTRGVLYISYFQLDLYKYNKGIGVVWEKKNDRLGTNEIMYSQNQALSDIARMYRKVLKHYDKYGYKDGGDIEHEQSIVDITDFDANGDMKVDMA
jgi:hypothetical protein